MYVYLSYTDSFIFPHLDCQELGHLCLQRNTLLTLECHSLLNFQQPLAKNLLNRAFPGAIYGWAKPISSAKLPLLVRVLS